ncbi:hypothetical protein PP940_gp174 [Rhizobium phage RL2RES]|uniref:Uncharacterized protein n=1 Tax=Rhizobium phage RL2RES TaxID=103371 RepID=A0A6B9J7V9_9CAUD|nr:hypothetical protein PP940_gp174 [Rhizobium phage RL2RES]QGZ14331.1 hypothetical protein RL2RES_174 [Rhizobium phage RL2RES]
MTTHTNLGKFENDREAKVRMTCEDCVYPVGSGCGHKWDVNCDKNYVENSHYSYYAAECPRCGKVNKEPA